MIYNWKTPADIVEIVCVDGKAVEIGAFMTRPKEQKREVENETGYNPGLFNRLFRIGKRRINRSAGKNTAPFDGTR